MKCRTADGVTTASALQHSPRTRRSNAGRPGATVAHLAFRSPRLLRCQSAQIRRCCPWLCAARHRQLGATVNCRSALPKTVCTHGHTASTHRSFTDSNHSTCCPRKSSETPSISSCVYYTCRGLTCVTHARMIAHHQSSAARDVPLQLYGSLRAVNVLLASCAPRCTVLAPPGGSACMAWRWSISRLEELCKDLKTLWG